MTPLDAQDIRDIRPPLALPVWWHWPLAIAVAALVALAVVLLVREIRRRRARALTPLERARRAIEVAEGHAREGRARQWADLVAETLRDGLAAKLGTSLLPKTTPELAHAEELASPRAAGLDVASLLTLLEIRDLARFAKASLTTEALLASTALASALVGELYPEPPRAARRRARRSRRVAVKSSARAETVSS